MMEVMLQNINATFTIIGAVLASFVIYYVKGIMKDMDQVRMIPELIAQVKSLLLKVDKVLLVSAVLEEKIKTISDRIDRLEMELSDFKEKESEFREKICFPQRKT